LVAASENLGEERDRRSVAFVTEWLKGMHDLAGDPQGPPGGGEDRDVGPTRRKSLDHRLADMFAVVEDQETGSVAQRNVGT
jgi:hypothetical protein